MDDYYNPSPYLLNHFNLAELTQWRQRVQQQQQWVQQGYLPLQPGYQSQYYHQPQQYDWLPTTTSSYNELNQYDSQGAINNNNFNPYFYPPQQEQQHQRTLSEVRQQSPKKSLRKGKKETTTKSSSHVPPRITEKRKVPDQPSPKVTPNKTAAPKKAAVVVDVIDLTSNSSKNSVNNVVKQELVLPNPIPSNTETGSNSIPIIPTPPSSIIVSMSSSSFLFDAAANLLSTAVEIELPTCPTPEKFSKEGIDYTVKKIVWWFLKNAKEPQVKCLFHPELQADYDENVPMEEDANVPSLSSSALYEELEEFRLASSSDEDEECDDKNIKKKSVRPEFFGAIKCLNLAKIRKPGTNFETSEFMNLFEIDSEITEESENFKGTCVLCNEKFVDKTNLCYHLKSKAHNLKLKETSLILGKSQYEEKNEQLDPLQFSARLKIYPLEDLVPKPKASTEYSRDHKVSALERRMALASFRITEFDINEDCKQNDLKITLESNEKWSSKLEKQWIKMKKAEQKLIEEYSSEREKFMKDPSSHPSHVEEWNKFWNSRTSELIKEGLDPESHNFKAEWASFWIKKMLSLMKTEYEGKIYSMKKSMELDVDNLRKLAKKPSSRLKDNRPSHSSSSTGFSRDDRRYNPYLPLPQQSNGNSNHYDLSRGRRKSKISPKRRKK